MMLALVLLHVPHLAESSGMNDWATAAAKACSNKTHPSRIFFDQQHDVYATNQKLTTPSTRRRS